MVLPMLVFESGNRRQTSVSVEAWPAFADHSIVIAAVSYKLEKEERNQSTGIWPKTEEAQFQ